MISALDIKIYVDTILKLRLESLKGANILVIFADHFQRVNALEREEKAKRALEALSSAPSQENHHSNSSQSDSSLSPQQQSTHEPSLPQIALQQQMALGGKGRRKQSNPMKRPREEGRFCCQC